MKLENPEYKPPRVRGTYITHTLHQNYNANKSGQWIMNGGQFYPLFPIPYSLKY